MSAQRGQWSRVLDDDGAWAKEKAAQSAKRDAALATSIKRALDKVNGNVAAVAEAMGVSRGGLLRQLRRLSLVDYARDRRVEAGVTNGRGNPHGRTG